MERLIGGEGERGRGEGHRGSDKSVLTREKGRSVGINGRRGTSKSQEASSLAREAER